MADDTISRKATIDAMEDVDWYHINKDGQLTHGANSEEDEPLYKAEDVYKVLNDIPSAQSNVPDTNVGDTISRQAAIDVLEERLQANGYTNVALVSELNRSIGYLMRLPSAQPEIVRCKDCIFHGLCRTSPKWAVAPKDDWYCADAERRTDE